jgi:hypothetical protein
MVKRLKRDGWGNFFGLSGDRDTKLEMLIREREALMRRWNLLELELTAGSVDPMRIHALMLTLNCFDQALIENAQYRKVLDQM